MCRNKYMDNLKTEIEIQTKKKKCRTEHNIFVKCVNYCARFIRVKFHNIVDWL